MTSERRGMASDQAQSERRQRKAVDEVPADTRRGGDVRTLLSPKTVGSTSGFMGVATLAPGDRISEHYHPYSEEFIFLATGKITAQLDGEPQALNAREALYIPINVKHRLVNDGAQEAFLVFHLGPLAPEPHLGHVDTE
jgi:putative monooxygenase